MTPEEFDIVAALQKKGIKMDEATGRDILQASLSVIKQDAAKEYPLVDSLVLDILFLTLEEFAISLVETEDVDMAIYYINEFFIKAMRTTFEKIK